MLSALYICTYVYVARCGTHACGGGTVAEAQAELVLDSGWPPLAHLGSVGEGGGGGVREQRRETLHRNCRNVIMLLNWLSPSPFWVRGFPGNEETG